MPEITRRDAVRGLGVTLPLSVMAALGTKSAQADPPAADPPPPAAPAATPAGAAAAVAAPAPAAVPVATPPPPPPAPVIPLTVLDEGKAKEIIAAVKPAVVLLEAETERGMKWGSGFFVSSDGLLITNRHVVDKHQRLTCILKNKQKVSAQVVKVDPQYDLALVQVAITQPVATVSLGDSDTVRAGQLVGVTGYPEPRDMVYIGMALDSSTSRGSINGLRFGGESNSMVGDTVLQIDAPAAHGNSGGPVFTLDSGEVVGVLTWIMGSNNLTFAVPSNPVKVLLSSAGKRIQPRPVKHDSKDAIVEPGELRTLNTISVSKELPALFGYGFEMAGAYDASRTENAVRDWNYSSGQAPSRISPMQLFGDELYFGSIDGTLKRWNVSDNTRSVDLLLDTGDGTIFVYGPQVNEKTVCAVSNALRLNLEEKDATTAGGMALSILTAGILGGKKSRTAVSIRGDGRIYGLNRRNGNIDWELETGFVGTPILYNDRVYYGGLGERGCIESDQGRVVWRLIPDEEFEREKWYHIGHASAYGLFGLVVPVKGKTRSEEGNRVLMYGDGKAFVAKYDPNSDKELWKSDEFGDIKDRTAPLSTALHVDPAKNVAYALANQFIAAISTTDGKILWKRDLIAEAEEEAKKFKEKKEKFKGLSFQPNMLVQNGIIYVGATDRRMYALNGADGKELWYYNTRNQVGAPVYHDGQLLFGSRDGYLHVINAQTGALNWRVYTGSDVRTAPVVHGGIVYAPLYTGNIFTVRIPVA